ncbi:hypothetical protein HYH03_012230 [Edaphochlamys debaryana]|uniref:phytol kinase n=1 Tax=Edaphochlamys debaryana TaxID=47281 RepID=A0A836BU57_9CHLO|nr:hypothetical protein HYH03_012230 [Edaphochlamys debaryana]|eukprot:KAG2489206.1 hypothetical protein HYH03_012230 [Edaphochlamys debaryana]
MATIASLGKLWRAYMDSGDQLLELFCNSDRPDLSRKVERSAQLKADRDMLHSAQVGMSASLWLTGMGEAGAEGDSGAGGSGAAAVAATEVAWEELWEHHGQVLAASLGLWQHARLDQLPVPNEARLPPEPGVPPGLQLAELEAKSAEALGRLSRGQGLGGAYPKRLLPTFESFFAVLGPGEPSLSPAEAVLALETSAWVLAMTSEGLADGGTQQERGRTPREDLLHWLGIAVKHMWLASSRVRNAWRDAADPRRADLILRLRGAGLGASLDCALRLAFTATQRADAPDPQAAKMLSDVPQHISFTCQCLRHGGLGLEALAPAEGDSREAVLGEAGGLVLTLRQQGAELAAAGRAGALAVELEAYGMQAASRLAARLAADAAGLQPPHHPERDESITRALVMCVYDIEDLSGQLGDPTAPARLLACQPHRLLAAACKLLCAPRLPAAAAGAGPAGAGRGAAAREPAAPTAYSWASTWRSRLMAAVQRCAYGLAANPALSARVRRWLRVREEGCSAGAQPVLAAEAEAASGAAAEAEAERGCMGQAWLAALRTARQATEGGEGALGLLLLHSARRPPAGPGEGSNAAFRQAAAALAPLVRGEVGDWLAPPEAVAAVESLARIPAAQLRNDVAAVLAAPLPLPLAVPPEGWRLTRLRVCGYPGCESFGERCESDLPLKQCGGCKGLRYCGANCQRAHWREGHSAECKALAAARRAAEAAS